MLKKFVYLLLGSGCLLFALVITAYWNQPPHRPYVPPREFDPSSASGEPLYNVKRDGRYGCMNQSGKIVIEAKYDDIRCSSDRLIPVELNGEWGYVSQSGEMILEPQFTLAAHGYSNNFSNGLAAVCQNSKCGYIDESGKYTIQPIFDSPGHFYEGFATVRFGGSSFLGLQYKRSRLAVINREGEIVYGEPEVVPDDEFSDGLARVIVSGKKAFVRNDGTIVFFANALGIGDFSEGLAIFSTKDLYRFGYVDREGKIIIPQQFKQAGEFSGGLASVMFENGKYGYINRSGSTVIEPRFDYAGTFYEDRAVVSVGRKNGYIDRSGKEVIPVQFGSAERFKDGLAQVSFDDQNPPYETKKYGYINRYGVFVLEPTN